MGILNSWEMDLPLSCFGKSLAQEILAWAEPVFTPVFIDGERALIVSDTERGLSAIAVDRKDAHAWRRPSRDGPHIWRNLRGKLGGKI